MTATARTATALLLATTMIWGSAQAQPADSLAEVYGEALEDMPDWTGIWNLVGGIMFPGPEHAVYVDDPAPET